jgi:hypothetical protein
VHLAARKAQIPSNVWRKLLLDLVVDIAPLDRPAPNTLIALLRDALGLPENHDVGGWPLTAGRSRRARMHRFSLTVPTLNHTSKTCRSTSCSVR